MSVDVTEVGRFSVTIASDMDHEKVFAEVNFDGKFVALVSQERGLGSKTLEFPGIGLVEDQICREVDLDGFLQALLLAAQKLAGE